MNNSIKLARLNPVILIIIFTSLGFILGMLVQQMIIKQSLVAIGYSFSGMVEEVNIDFNETLIVEKSVEMLVPLLNRTIEQKNES